MTSRLRPPVDPPNGGAGGQDSSPGGAGSLAGAGGSAAGGSAADGNGGAGNPSGGTGFGGSSAGTGGALSSGGVGGMPIEEPLVFDDYGVVCEDRNNGNTTSAQFSVGIHLVNATTEPIPLEEVTVRYYFTSNNEADPMLRGHLVFVDDASPTYGLRDNVQFDVFALDPPEMGADHYVEISFGEMLCNGAPCVLPPTPDGAEPSFDHRPIQLRVQIDPAALRYDITDDYSFVPGANGQVLCETITLYRDGVLIFGTEPDGTMPEPPGGDAGVPDGGAFDGGTSEPSDAGMDPIDAGSGAMDGGAPDFDASLPMDAGTPPEPMPDAAPLGDAATSADAGFDASTLR